jgi:hypothetical protein
VSLFHISIGLALTGLACFLWPVVQRLLHKPRADDTAVADAKLLRGEPPNPFESLRSKVWWVGFILTAAALWVQRLGAE